MLEPYLSNQEAFLVWLAGYALLICAGIFYDSYILGKGGRLSGSSTSDLFHWGWTWPLMLPALALILAVLAPSSQLDGLVKLWANAIKSLDFCWPIRYYE